MGKSDKKGKKGKSVAAGRTKPISRAVGWLLLAVLGGVSAFIVTNVEGILEDVVVVPEMGDPVKVKFVGFGEKSGDTMALPPKVPVEESDIAALNSMPHDEQMAWLEERGASRIAPMYPNVVLTGNRDKPVRVMDITPVSECVTPAEAGTLFFYPPAGGDDTIQLDFDLDLPEPVAMVTEEVGGEFVDRPYFDFHTVSLEEGEQQVFQISLNTRLSTCSVVFDISILDGDDLKTQRFSRDGEPFRVTADLPHPYWQQVYLGGVVSCIGGGFAPATEAWFREDLYHCE